MMQNSDPALAVASPSPADAAAVALPASQERALWPAVMRGWRCRCPACGAGPLFRGYLKVHDSCPSCGEELHHQRADDGPAYVTLIIVGHILAPVMLFLFGRWEPDPLITATVLSIAFAALCLFLLPRVKGAFIALQWAKRMHGFGHSPKG